MSELTGQEIVSDIATRLRARFPENIFVEIYKDKPVQTMRTPCIFIHSVESSDTPDLRDYSWWNFIIDIRCHPGRMVTSINTWARSLGPIITETVGKLTVSGQQVKASRSTWRIESGVLHVILTYRFRVMKAPAEIPDMQTLEFGERIKD